MRALILFFLMSFGSDAFAKIHETDICVYGRTAGGVASAVQVAMGKTVVLLESDKHLGGLTSGGLSATDIGNKGAFGGISREFYQRLGKHYGTNEMWTFVPHVAECTLHQMLNELKVPIHTQQLLASVKRKAIAFAIRSH